MGKVEGDRAEGREKKLTNKQVNKTVNHEHYVKQNQKKNVMKVIDSGLYFGKSEGTVQRSGI